MVYSVAFNPDGKTLASGAADGTVRLWDVASHRQIRRSPAIYIFSPDGKTLASGAADGLRCGTWLPSR